MKFERKLAFQAVVTRSVQFTSVIFILLILCNFCKCLLQVCHDDDFLCFERYLAAYYSFI